MSEILKLDWFQMASAYFFLLMLLFIVKKLNIGVEKELLISTIRMTGQLIIVGYLLSFIFLHPHALITIAIFMVMVIFAVFNIFGRVKGKIQPALKKVIALAMLIGTTGSLMYFLFVVIRLSPWFNPRYFIPLGGMIIGNSMTGIALGADRLINGIKNGREKIECALMLGAKPVVASKPFVQDAFRSAIMPTVNSMVGMGIIFLPGMMTGQILSGTNPTTAIEYQIAIMLGIAGSVGITVYIMTEFGYRVFFNKESQLVLE